jgi:hypothetical protein
MLVRKIAVGNDYKNSMNYIVGQSILNNMYTIFEICRENDGSVCIWIRNEERGEIMRWKMFSANMPISFEYNIDF